MAEVAKQIRAMVAFIDQEAHEKAEEIRVNADRTARNDTATFIHTEKLRLNKEYEKKAAQIEQKRRIQQSMAKRQAMLKMLSEKENLAEQLKADTIIHLKRSTKNDDYGDFLLNCAVEAALRVDEATIKLQCCARDVAFLQKNVQRMQDMYGKACTKEGYRGKHKNVMIQVNTTQMLAEEKIGGVIAFGLGGRIKVDNTIEARLNISMHDLLPEINSMLFPKQK